MKNRKLQIQQLEAKMKAFGLSKSETRPANGWLRSVRTALGMTLEQLGNRLSIAKQNVGKLEQREQEGSITLNSLRQAANALDMELVYGLVPKDGSLGALIERKARELAIEIVSRTSNTMKLEDQENSNERIRRAINERTEGAETGNAKNTLGLNLDYNYGQTPLDEEEKEGLLIPSISTKAELDEFEQQNVEEAIQWVLGRSLKAEAIFTERFVKSLHKRMYGNVWKWAGQFRRSDKNFGIDKWQIPMALRSLLEDALFWVKNETYAPDEIAIRFKHRIVSIHCFSNGNGRHSRLMADLIVDKIYKRSVFSWGAWSLSGKGEAREMYLKAVKAADEGDYRALLDFARA